jgi:hypothetical protein
VTSRSGIALIGIGTASGSTDPFTGGRSWNMKSHFHRSEGFDAWSQCLAATGRPKASAAMFANPGSCACSVAMALRMCAGLA